jgi:hypothetical protein
LLQTFVGSRENASHEVILRPEAAGQALCDSLDEMHERRVPSAERDFVDRAHFGLMGCR